MRKGIKTKIVAGGTALAMLAAGIPLAGTAWAESSGKDLKQVLTSAGVEAVDVSEVVKNAMPSIVAVMTASEKESPFGGWRGARGFGIRQEGAGSGVIASQDEDSIMIITNAHVVNGADEVRVCFSAEAENEDDLVAPAKVNGKDSSLDIAILTVEKDDVPEEICSQLRTARLGSSDDLEVGEPAIAIGNALGTGQTVTAGIISALEKPVRTEGSSIKGIQTDAAINLGCSGGAILDKYGNVIAITEAKSVSDYAECMGYGIPIDSVKEAVERLSRERDPESEEEKGFLGVTVMTSTEGVRELYGIPEGAYVTEVEEDGAAAKAGIMKGDIITELGGEPVNGTKSLLEKLDFRRAGEEVDLKVMRADEGEYVEKELNVVLEKDQNADEKAGTDVEKKNDEDENEAEGGFEEENDLRIFGINEPEDLEELFGGTDAFPFFEGRNEEGTAKF